MCAFSRVFKLWLYLDELKKSPAYLFASNKYMNELHDSDGELVGTYTKCFLVFSSTLISALAQWRKLPEVPLQKSKCAMCARKLAWVNKHVVTMNNQ